MKVFLVKASDGGFFRVESSLRSLPEEVKIRTSLFMGHPYPLSYPFPKRVDMNVQGFVGLMGYDLVVLVNVDPEVLSVKEQRDLISYVEAGGGLLLIGGVHSLGNSYGTYQLLDPLLPASFPKEKAYRVDAEAKILKRHYITSGLPEGIGKITRVCRIEPKEDGETLMEVDGHPLLVVKEYGRGRVVVLSAYPTANEVVEGIFFTSDFYDDLVRQLVLWLTHRESSIAIKEFVPTKRCMFTGGEEDKCWLKLASDKSADVKVKFRVFKNGGEISSEERSLVGRPRATFKGEGTVSFSFRAKEGYENKGVYTLTAEVLEGGKVINLRDWKVEVFNKTRLKVNTVSWKDVVDPGSLLELSIKPVSEDGFPLEKALIRTRITDSKGEVVNSFPDEKLSNGQAEVKIEYEVPALLKGEYKIECSLIEEETNNVLDVTEKKLYVVDPLELEDFFPIMSDLEYMSEETILDESMIRERIDDIMEHGYNTIELRGSDLKNYDWNRNPNWQKMLNYTERYAQMKGLALTYHYGALIECLRHKPPSICVNSPGFPAYQRSLAMPQFGTASKVPRTHHLETVDEPLTSPDSICQCQYCKDLFKKTYGEEMPDPKNIRDYAVESRMNLYHFVSDYWAKGFGELYEIKKSTGANFLLCQQLCQLSFGTFCSEYYFRDSYAWAPYADILSFDTYPYMYPIWGGSEKLKFHAVHHHLSGHKALTRHYKQPLGFYVETTDRNYPMYVAPPEASREITYTALAHGVNWIRTFINVTFSDGVNLPRKERFDKLGEDLKKIARVGPVLTKVDKPRAKVAMLFPFTHWLLNHPHPKSPIRGDHKTIEDRPFNDRWPFEYNPWNGYEVFFRAFGELEVVHERLVQAEGLPGYKALVLLGVEYLPDDVAQTITGFVEEGGILFFDRIPSCNDKGENSVLLRKLLGKEDVQLFNGLKALKGEYGKGKTLFFCSNIDKAYTVAVEEDDMNARKLLKNTIRSFLFGEGIKPRALAENFEFEVGFLEGDNCFLLVVVNHKQRKDESVIHIYEPGFTPVFAYDVAEKGEVCFDVKDGVVSFCLEVDKLAGKIIGFYPERPVKNSIKVESESVKRGEMFSYTATLENAKGKPALGSQAVEITVTDPDGTEHSRYGGLHSTANGVYSRKMKMAVNAPKGRWKIKVHDPYTRTISQTHFKVP